MAQLSICAAGPLVYSAAQAMKAGHAAGEAALPAVHDKLPVGPAVHLNLSQNC